ncbi:MAG: SDR family NAD(P)-dependent oxidoreductase, partial [Armatimonadota bacterium]|nr:SDR family NAD(P)-dependent oxidoreductase [Armatimonadota bacterium]
MPVLDLFKLDGRVALVTGGNRGIGRAIAQALAEAGASIAVTSRDEARADKTATEIAESTGQKCLGLALDVRDGKSVETTMGQVMSRLGGMDILVNNAGINIRESITELDDESWHNIIETNLAGAMRCSRIAARHMKEKGWGRIINIGSILSFIGIP